MEENQELRTVPFVTEDGEQVEMYVLEETTLQGIHYILVTEDLSDDSEEAVVMIMKEEKQSDEDEFALYDRVKDSCCGRASLIEEYERLVEKYGIDN